jgi:hypothetical protein
MVCKRYSDALSDVAAGAPPPAALDLHLAACGHCRGELAALQKALATAGHVLGYLAAVEPPAGFAQRIRAAAIRDAAPPVRANAWLWPACAAASALVIAIVLFVAVQPPRVAAELVENPQPMPASTATTRTPSVDSGSGAHEVASVAPALRPERHYTRLAAPEPPILVPPGQSAALMAFVASLSPDEPVADTPASDAEPAPALATLAPITIRPIEIVPLDPPAHLGT